MTTRPLVSITSIVLAIAATALGACAAPTESTAEASAAAEQNSPDLKAIDAAVDEISRLDRDELVNMLVANGYTRDRAERTAKRYPANDQEAFKTAFKKDFRFEAVQMLATYKEATALLARQNAAIDAISELNGEELVALFECFGFDHAKAEARAARYPQSDFRKTFKADYRFEAERMLANYKSNNCAPAGK